MSPSLLSPLGSCLCREFFCSLCPPPLFPISFYRAHQGWGICFGKGDNATTKEDMGGTAATTSWWSPWEQRHHPATPGLDTVPGVGLTLLLEYMGMGQSSHCPTGHVCPHRLFKEHNDSLVDHVPKEREALLEREFQRVTISGEEKCGVSLPPDPPGTQARVSRLPTPAWGLLFVWCPLSRCPSPTCWMRPRAW